MIKPTLLLQAAKEAVLAEGHSLDFLAPYRLRQALRSVQGVVRADEAEQVLSYLVSDKPHASELQGLYLLHTTLGNGELRQIQARSGLLGWSEGTVFYHHNGDEHSRKIYDLMTGISDYQLASSLTWKAMLK